MNSIYIKYYIKINILNLISLFRKTDIENIFTNKYSKFSKQQFVSITLWLFDSHGKMIEWQYYKHDSEVYLNGKSCLSITHLRYKKQYMNDFKDLLFYTQYISSKDLSDIEYIMISNNLKVLFDLYNRKLDHVIERYGFRCSKHVKMKINNLLYK